VSTDRVPISGFWGGLILVTVPLWVPILVAFLGVSGTLGAALLTQWISNNRADQREKSRQEHEIAKEAQRQEHENHLKELKLEGTRIEKA
jgi:hypothetical protein